MSHQTPIRPEPAALPATRGGPEAPAPHGYSPGYSPEHSTMGPLALVIGGFLAVLLALFSTSSWALLPGLLMMVAGGMWGAMRSREQQTHGRGPLQAGG